MKKKKDPVGAYTDHFKSGKRYHGKGHEKRAKLSAKKIEDDIGDELDEIDWEESENDRQAFIDEFHRLDEDGGPDDDNNYNLIQSPGKKYLEEDMKKKQQNDNDNEDTNE